MVNRNNGLKPETKIVHEGDLEDRSVGNIHTPLYGTSVFYYPNSQAKLKDKSRDLPFIYSRLGNPTVQSLEIKYATLEGAEDALAFSSGMSAISTTIFTFLKKGDRLLALSGLYGQTLDLFKNHLPSLGIVVDFIDINKLNNMDFEPRKYKMIFVESIINPTLEVTDLIRIGKEADETLKVVDASMASPVNQNPLKLGMDIVIQSATKYISGMDDVVAGLIAGNNELINRIAEKRKALGTIMDPFTAFLLIKNIKTIFLRVRTQNSNALFIAKELQKMGLRVNYPGLSNVFYQIAKRNLKGYGGVLSFDLNVSYTLAEEFMNSLQIIKKAPTFGGIESLITLPWETSHTYISEEERLKLSITPSLIRLSVGIEDRRDILGDLKKSIFKINKKKLKN